MMFLRDHILAFKKQDGFSLLEMLLAVSAFAAISLGFVEMSEDYLLQKRAISVAEHIEEVHDAAEALARDNFQALYALVPVVGDTELLDGVGAGVADNNSVDDLIANGYLPATFQGANILANDVLVIIRNAGAAGGGLTERLEIFTLTSGDPINEDIAIEAAYEIGGFAGIWSGMDRDVDAAALATTTDDVVNLFGLWQFPVANMNLAANAPAVVAPTIDVREAHIVTYSFINYSDSLGDYLYRVDVAGMNDENVMYQPIEMNAFNVDGVDNFDVSGNLSTDNVSALGVVGTRGNVNVTSLLTSGDVSAASLQPNGTSVYTTDVTTDINAGSIDMSAATGVLGLNVTGDFTASDFDASDVSVTNATTVNTLQATGTTNFAVVNMEVTDMLMTGATQMVVGTLNGGGADVDIAGAADAEGISSISGNVTFSGGAYIEGNAVFSSVNGLTQFTCDDGC